MLFRSHARAYRADDRLLRAGERRPDPRRRGRGRLDIGRHAPLRQWGVAAKASAPADGWAALREGDWPAARARFEAALERSPTPDALEGLSWAAWWLDDEPAVFRTRERAYRMYKQQGDPAGAARMATWLAADHLDFHGAWPVARGWCEQMVAARVAGQPAGQPRRAWHGVAVAVRRRR